MTQEMGDIKKMISEDPTNIEKLTHLKDYINNVPVELEKLRIRMN